MISIENLIEYIHIPDEWIFEKYLNLPQLNGQDIKMKSVFNSGDNDPSMFVYYDTGKSSYRFKDFSSGYGGNAIYLVSLLENITYQEAYEKIYNDYINSPETIKAEIIPEEKYKVSDYEIRSWNQLDSDYWTAFKINSKSLETYEVYPLEFYTMSKPNLDGTVSSFTVRKDYIYGYFNKLGELIKIYQPKNLDKKFLKVKNYLQGWDQLEYKVDNLILVSSLKDLLSFKSLGFSNFESLAPDSENSIIPLHIISNLKTKYKRIFVLFDNDTAGKIASEKYNTYYDTITLELKLSKDLSDSVRDHGQLAVRNELIKQLKEMSNVNHPEHYGGETNPYEAIKVIEAWNLGFCLGNVVKYISRAGKKDPDKHIQDLEKALWYLQREIDIQKQKT
jgi:5S rRNA maturation endonuclease (ribonuclease M5)